MREEIDFKRRSLSYFIGFSSYDQQRYLPVIFDDFGLQLHATKIRKGCYKPFVSNSSHRSVDIAEECIIGTLSTLILDM